jgi:RNA polymerase-binding protein DksA
MTADLVPRQIAGLNIVLQERLDSLLEEVRQELLKSDDEQYVQLADQVHDVEEQSVADLLADVNLAIIDLHIHEVRDIEAALIRIRTGTFGACIDCGEEIGYPRLQAYPIAKRCHDCQVRSETQASIPTL